jgi:hypothetical protein
MKVQFQADADFNEKIVKAVLRREPSIDFRTAQAAGLPGLMDEDFRNLRKLGNIVWNSPRNNWLRRPDHGRAFPPGSWRHASRPGGGYRRGGNEEGVCPGGVSSWDKTRLRAFN